MRLDWYLHFQCPIYKLSSLAGPFVSGKHYHVSKIVAIAFNVQPPCADMLSKQLNIDTVWAVIWGHLTPQSTMAQWHCLVKDRVPQAYYHSEVSQNGYPKVNIGFNTKKNKNWMIWGYPHDLGNSMGYTISHGFHPHLWKIAPALGRKKWSVSFFVDAFLSVDWMEIQHPRSIPLLSKKHTRWGPPVFSWFISTPLAILYINPIG